MTLIVPLGVAVPRSQRSEDELIERVQAHIVDAHGSRHVPPREQLLSRAREQPEPHFRKRP